MDTTPPSLEDLKALERLTGKEFAQARRDPTCSSSRRKELESAYRAAERALAQKERAIEEAIYEANHLERFGHSRQDCPPQCKKRRSDLLFYGIYMDK